MINILICDDEINDANIVKACIENLLDSKKHCLQYRSMFECDRANREK